MYKWKEVESGNEVVEDKEEETRREEEIRPGSGCYLPVFFSPSCCKLMLHSN